MNNKGFTLVEVIISIAVLSILCVIFLQLFVKADAISNDAKVLDYCMLEVNNNFEKLYSLDSEAVIESSGLFSDIEVLDDQIVISEDLSILVGVTKKESLKLNITLIPRASKKDYETRIYDVTATVCDLDGELLYEANTNILLD